LQTAAGAVHRTNLMSSVCVTYPCNVERPVWKRRTDPGWKR
jgi:hypothetical protein